MSTQMVNAINILFNFLTFFLLVLSFASGRASIELVYIVVLAMVSLIWHLYFFISGKRKLMSVMLTLVCCVVLFNKFRAALSFLFNEYR